MPEVMVTGWMTEDERLFLKRLAFGKKVLELGSYEGLSTISIACTAKHVTAVDTFDGRGTPEPKDTLNTFVNNLNSAGMLPRVRILQGEIGETLPTLAEEGEKYDLIFIDADHFYKSVKRDIALSLPLLAEGGVIAFHDYNESHKRGVVRAVDEFVKKTGATAIEQQDSLVAFKLIQSVEEEKKPLVYVCMPHRNLEVNLGAAAGLHFASNNKYRQIVSNYGTSVLTLCFNTLLCEALNARDNEGVTHFAMLHNDVIPAKGWLDCLMQEMEAGDYDMVSAIVPLKNGRGLTSTGIGGANHWSVRRLSMTEVFNLPETFSAKHIPYRQDGEQLLLNTGCWLMRLDRPWVNGLCFRQQDCVAWSVMDKKYVAQSISEDWDFSRQLHSRGCRIAATRKIPITHERPEFHNQSVWGEWTTDEEFARTERAIAEYEAQSK